MPHLSGRCYYGRRVHFPNGAQLGHRWCCHKCSTTWTITKRGNRMLRPTRSKPPKRRAKPAMVPPALPSVAPDNGTSGLVVFLYCIAAVLILGVLTGVCC